MKNVNDNRLYGSRRAKARRSGGSCLGGAAAAVGALVSVFWLLNFQMGIFELPDNLPIVGNLDEAFFTVLFLYCLSYFGIELPFLSRDTRRFQYARKDVDSEVEIRK